MWPRGRAWRDVCIHAGEQRAEPKMRYHLKNGLMGGPSTFLGDLRFALRLLPRSPGFTLIVASCMPARYASRIGPVETLRAE
jgi:hypothetical protein